MRTEAFAAPLRQSSPLPVRGMATDKPSDDNKKEPIKQDSEESPLGSSPEGDGEPADSGEQGQAVPTPEGQAPKRKGGRKPVCEYPLGFPVLSELSSRVHFRGILPRNGRTLASVGDRILTVL